MPVPTDFGLPYQDLTLTTPDDVKLKCYLLTQRKELQNVGAADIDASEEETDEEVCVHIQRVIRLVCAHRMGYFPVCDLACETNFHECMSF